MSNLSPIDRISASRLLTEWTGAVTDEQLTTLKRALMVVLNIDKLVLKVDLDQRFIEIQANLPDSDSNLERITDIIAVVLGINWVYKVTKVEDELRKSRQLPLPKRKGKRGSSKGRKRPKK